MVGLLDFFYVLGVLTTGYLGSQLLSFIRLFTRPSSLPRYLHGTAPWALVTGSSDGIGKAFARELSSRGFNVVLHGRNPAKLAAVERDLAKDFPQRNYRVVVADATEPSLAELQKTIDSILASISDLHLTVLINNAGGVGTVTHDGRSFTLFEQSTALDIDRLIMLNLRFQTQLTRALLPQLMRHSGPSLIMNIGSAADHGLPYVAVYGGTKAYNMTWSLGLAAEMKTAGRDVEVLGIRVGNVTDVAHNKASTSWMMPRAPAMVRAALDRVGCGRVVVTPYLGHALSLGLMECLPDALLMPIVISMSKSRIEEEARNH